MTIRTKEAEASSEFPPARLFLDDIEEIVGILLEAVENCRAGRPRDEGDKTKITLTIKDRLCDEVRELPLVAKQTNALSVRVEGTIVPVISLTFSRGRTYLDCPSLTREQKLMIFTKLAPIFKRRNRWLGTLFPFP